MANEVRIRAWVKDEVSGSIGKITDKFDHLGKSKGFQSIAMGVGMGAGFAALGALQSAVGGVTQVLGDATKAALEEEASVKKLDAALIANVESFDGNTDAIEKTLGARMRLGFADDEQRDSLARLVSVTKDSTKALQLQRQAMDLARLRGIDLAAASDIVGKVYGGNIGILARYGIQLKKGVTATEALAEVQRRAAGQAEAYANTNAGKLLASQIKVGEAMEKLGAVTLPAVVTATEAAADAIEDMSGVLDNLSVDIPVVDANLGDLVKTARDLSSFSAPLLNVNGIFELMADTTDGLGISTEKMREQLRGMGIDVETAAVSAANAMSTFSGKADDDLNFVTDALGEVGEATEDLKDDSKRELGKAAYYFGKYRDSVIGDARDLLGKAYDPLIRQDELLADIAEVNAARRILASGKATKAEIRDAEEVLNSTGKDIGEALIEMAEHGETTSKAYKKGIRELKAAIKTATGPTKVYLQAVLDKLLEIERVGKVVPINIRVRTSGTGTGTHGGGSGPQEFAEGGFVRGPKGKAVPAIVHAGEYVISNSDLDKARAGGGIGPLNLGAGGVLTVNVMSAGVLSPAHGQAIAREIGPHLRDYLNRRG